MLRAVAVLLVVLDHLVGRPRGGYVGVDVFFVLSGFLITGVLLREQERNGRIALRAFYRRRVKRLGPAAALVLVVVAVLSSVLFTTARRDATWTDTLWALCSAANWRFIAVGTDYLHGGTAASPLQHFWSLAVEEQFYLVWPLALLIVAAVAAHRGRRAATLAALVLTGASLAWAAHESVVQPTWAYFSTASRAWELGAGALLACAAPALERVAGARRIRATAALVGLVAIGLSALVLDSESRFPVPGALPAVLGTLLIVAAGTGTERAPLPLFRLRPAVAVGSASYSLYLWHFPVIVLVASAAPRRDAVQVALTLVLMAALALLSYRFVETPLRYARWRRPSAVRLLRARFPMIQATALLAIVVVAAGAIITLRPQAASAADAARAASDGSPRDRAIATALAATSWPALAPAVDRLGAQAKAPQWVRDGCLGDDVHALADPVANAERCVYGDPRGSHRIVLSGDSIAISYLPGLIAALAGQHWRIEVWTRAQCPAVEVPVVRADGSDDPGCPAFRHALRRHVAAVRPDVVVLSSTSNGIDRLAAPVAADPSGAWRRGTTTTVRELSRSAGRVVLLADPPSGPALQDCLTPISRPSDCGSAVDGRWLAVDGAQRAGAAGAAGVVVPDVRAWYCSSSGACPAFLGRTPTLADGMHLTAVAARQLAPLLRAAIEPSRGRAG